MTGNNVYISLALDKYTITKMKFSTLKNKGEMNNSPFHMIIKRKRN